ncbi:MAG TPA: patatin-like phospholipase family protein [Azospirillaceae bacterium]|nr:patatin-like phospholipase family protein [Azospirillaceae bacterium]
MAGGAPLALILSGGVGLGAYHGGAWQAVEEAGLSPAWIAGSSIGAVTAVLVAGNPPERRLERLRAFWDMAAQPNAASAGTAAPLSWLARDWRRALSAGGVLSSRLAGRPGLFSPRLPGLLSLVPGMPGDTGLYDARPLRATLEALVDWDRVNGGEFRLTVTATDVETAETVLFDTTRERIGVDHILATTAFLPDFPPVELGGRMLVDGGLSANAPLEPVAAGLEGAWRLLLVDLFDPGGFRPCTLTEAVERRTELLFSSQTRRAVEAMRREADLRAAAGNPQCLDLVRVACRNRPADVMNKAYDFTAETLRERWELGRRATAEALSLLGGAEPEAGFRVREIPTL